MIILQIVLVTAYETHNIVLGENSQVSETITVFGTECTETEKVNIFIIFVMSILPILDSTLTLMKIDIFSYFTETFSSL